MLSGWFRTDWLASWLVVAATRDAQARFEILTRDDAEQVRRVLDPNGLLGQRLTIPLKAPEEMPEAIRAHDLSIMFFTEGLSKLVSSPISRRSKRIMGEPYTHPDTS